MIVELGNLFEKYNQPIGKFILSNLVRNRCIAPLVHYEDIKSSVFVKLAEYLEIKTLENPKGFLYKIARNDCFSHFRRPPCSRAKSKIKIVSLDDLTKGDLSKLSSCSVHQLLEEREIILKIKHILQQEISLLEDKYQNAIEDYCKKHTEIAERRGISVDTSRKSRSLANHLLRQALLKRGIKPEDCKIRR